MSTGFGLNPADQKAGITAIMEKLENMCPLYAEMDKIFGNRPEVNPLFLANAEVLEDEDNKSESSSEHDGSNSSYDSDKTGSSKTSESTAIHPLLKSATSQVNIMTLEQENTGDLPIDVEAGVQAAATGKPTLSGETFQDPASKSKAVGTKNKSPKNKKNKSNCLQSTRKAPALSDSE
ncbi:uncharacterized protein PGTG_16700 [Puccinia graminis f. sp. tritici CRL 75-36-700-3]|uniref:Uncharacterized protein n=1 Tax=Puccinia graminis f. sp. tritici (strain CRL 75-36-700-3 / race SCCL) TaxID=418459 RepID=E3L299_PUCGT|nr:uncharacterized protein PGTG_16700 [Puccinia graminis f. sp. tritici CRL 75-36-700-3]EFP90674.2 hypothetical protein PGTG_16700 [Puccinia graminis f. sp. tritici CRL 75-36-700-3]